MKYKLVIFDLDGTLLNTLDDLVDSTNYALSKNHLPTRTLNEICSFVGNGIRKLIERSLPEGSSDTVVNQVHLDFTDYYIDHCNYKTTAYPGIVELLEKLKKLGVHSAVVSNKADDAVKQLCNLYFSNVIDFALGHKVGVPCKPEPDSVFMVLDEFSCEKSEAVFVGDSDIDIQTARNSGMDCICVSWGFREAEFLKKKGATTIISSPDELIGYLV